MVAEPVRRAFKIYLQILASFWIIAIVWAVIQHRSLSLGTDIRFSDFTIFDPRFRLWSRSTTAFFDQPGFPFPYPAPTLAAFLAFWTLAPNALIFYLAAVAGFALVAAVYLSFRYPTLRLAFAGTLLGSFPLYFLLDRANIEGIVWISLSLGVVAFAKQRFRSAAILIGLAASLKIFPALLILLFVSRKRYSDAALSVISAAVFTLGALFVAGPSMSAVFTRLASGLGYFRENVILQYLGPLTGFDHSAFSFLKQVLHAVFRGSGTHSAIQSVYMPYLLVAMVGFGALYATRIYALPMLNQLFALIVISVTLPFVSFDYTLVHLYIPFTALLISLAASQLTLSRQQMLRFLLPSAVLFSPLSWLVVGPIVFGAQIKTAALFALLYAALKIPLPTTLFGELKPKSNELIVLSTLSEAHLETVS